MDLGTLASQAINLVADHMASVAIAAAQGAEIAAIGALASVVSNRLSQSEMGSAVWRALQQDPDDAGNRSVATSALAVSASADAAFQAHLSQAVDTALRTQNVANSGGFATNQANVLAGGGVTMRHSQIAGGNVDNSRRTTIGTGGLVAIGAVAILALGMGTAGVVVATRDDGPPTPESVGTSQAEVGIRETVGAFLDAVASEDNERACAFVTPDYTKTVRYIMGPKHESCDVEIKQGTLFNQPVSFIKSLDGQNFVVDIGTGSSSTSGSVQYSEKISVGVSYSFGRWYISRISVR